MATDTSEKYSAFPSDLEPLEQKKTDRYGLEYVNAIYATNLINYPVNNPQYLEYINNREFAEGTYSTNIYKPRMGLDTDSSYLNLDLTSINRIPTILDNMVGKNTNKPWRFQCNPLDTVSRTKFDDKRAEMKADMFLKQKSEQAEQLTGQPLVSKSKFVPEDNEEAELHMQMNFKLDEAEAMELALKWVFDSNNFDADSLPAIYKDMFIDKKSAIFRYYDSNRNIRVKRWDHLKLITGYSSYEDFHDLPYQALSETYVIGDIAKMNPKFTDEDLYDIARNNAGLNGNMVWNPDWYLQYSSYNNSFGPIAYRQFQSFKIIVVNFYFLSPIHEVKAVKKSVTGKIRVEDKKVGYAPKKEKEKTFGEDTASIDVLNKTKITRFEGYWIPNTKKIWDYKQTENIERDVVAGAYSPEAELPCKIIMPNQLGMRNKSMVARMKPFEKQLVLAWLKLQQFLVKAMPPGLAINQNALLEIVNGQGDGKALPTDWTKLYQQTGNIIFSDTDGSGRIINGKPFEELQGGISAKFTEFLNVMDYCINKMNDVVGYNTAVDASSPKSDALVGVNQMAQQATYDCLRPIYNDVNKRLIEPTGKRIGLMIQDSLRLGNEDFKRALIDAIGQKNVDALIEGRDMPLSSSGISVETQPDEDEIASLNSDIQLGISQGIITVSDKIRVMQQMKTNIKLAGQLLVYLENKNAKNKAKEAQALSAQNGQVQIQSAQAASQAQAQLDEVLTTNKIKVIEATAQFDMQIKRLELQNAMKLQELKNLGANTVAEINTGGKIQVQDAANKGKVVAAQVTADSKIETVHLTHKSDIQKGFQEHDHKMEQIEKEAELTPEPVAAKK
jgi:hypothetical protein